MVRDLDSIDRIGGRLLFHFIGGMLMVLVGALAFVGFGVLYAGPTFQSRLTSAAVLILAFLLGRLTAWCFDSQRRLSLGDPV